jgi:hypothetical protein
MPFTDQLTDALKLPVPKTVPEHWLVCPVCTLGELHETATEVMVRAGATITDAVPDLVESSEEVALMVSDPEMGTVAGAVYCPELEIVPEVAAQVTVEL